MAFGTLLAFAVRKCFRNSKFWLSSCFVLSIGAAGTIISASLISTIFIHPVRGADMARTVLILGAGKPPEQDRLTWWSQASSLDETALYSSGVAPMVSSDGLHLTPTIGIVTPHFFQVFNVHPMIGSDSPSDTLPYPLFISDVFWKRNFGEAHPVIGATYRIDGKIVTLSGIVPASFRFPGRTDVWVIDRNQSFMLNAEEKGQSGLGPRLTDAFIGRLRSGTSIDSAQSELRTMQDRLATVYGNSDRRSFGLPVRLIPLANAISSSVNQEYRSAVLGGIILFLLTLINAMGLMAIRWREKRAEVAIRFVCGANLVHIRVICINEAIILSFCSSLLGLGFAIPACAFLRGLLIHQIPSIVGLGIDGISILSACASFLIVFTGLVIAAFSSVRVTETSAEPYNRIKMLGTGGDRHRFVIAASQIAIAYILISIGIASVSEVDRLIGMNRGFETNGLDLFHVSSIGIDKVLPSEVSTLCSGVLGIPGIQHAAIVDRSPLSRAMPRYLPISVGEASKRFLYPNVTRYSGDIIGAFTLKQVGRALPSCANGCVIINNFLAKHLDSRTLVAGDQVFLPSDGKTHLVGAVVDDVKSSSLDDEPEAQLYVPFEHSEIPVKLPSFTIAVRNATDSEPISGSTISQTLSRVDGRFFLLEAERGENIVSQSLQADIGRREILVGIAVAAAFVALTGMYVFLSNMIYMARPKIALQQVFGASRPQIIGWVFRRTFLCATAGSLTGLFISAFFIQAITSALGIAMKVNTATAIISVLLLECLALLAAALPAQRTLTIAPLEFLKSR
jgi:hypothetical protein